MRNKYAAVDRKRGKWPPSYAIVTDRNAGLGCILYTTAKAIRFGELTSRQVATCWTRYCFYSDGVCEDAFQLYFQPLNDISLSGLLDKRLDIFPGDLELDSLIDSQSHDYIRDIPFAEAVGRQEDLLIFSWLKEGIDFGQPAEVHAHLAKYFQKIKINSYFQSKADQFKLKNLDSNYIAVHARGGDKKLEQDGLYDLTSRYFTAIRLEMEAQQTNCVYLATDNPSLLRAYKQEFRELVYQKDTTRDDWCVHGHGDDYHMAKRYEIGSEAVIDLSIAQGSSVFIGNFRSYFSRSVYLWRDLVTQPCVLVDYLGD
jgi:hypothetical protein